MPVIHVLNASPRDADTKRELVAELTATYARVMRMKPDTIRWSSRRSRAKAGAWAV